MAYAVTSRRIRHHALRHLCVTCQARKALFRYRGIVKADRTHTLCFQCFRAAQDRARGLRALRALHFTGSADHQIAR